MSSTQFVEVIESLSLTGIGIIVELKHYFDGLPNNLELKSDTNRWRVKTRILYWHTLDKQITFRNEITLYMRCSFSTVEDMLSSSAKISENEANNIFAYQLEGIENDIKPPKGVILTPVR